MQLPHIITAAASLLVGVWTHILWDSFTHQNGWAVIRIAFLREPVFQVGSVDFPTYQLLQHLSTVGAIAVLTTTYYLWLQRAGASSWFVSEDRWRYGLLACVFLMALSIALPLGLAAAEHVQGFLGFRVFVFRTGIYSTAVFIPLFTLSAIFSYLARRAA